MFKNNVKDHIWFMKLALEEAYKAYRKDEVPVGVVIVSKDGDILSKSYNLKEETNNPVGHAEILAIQKAAEKLGNWRLKDCTIYVTLEPCMMCLNALVQARIGKLVFGAYDPKGGAISLNQNSYKDKRLNHNFPVIGGVHHYECSQVLSDFFKQRRKRYNK